MLSVQNFDNLLRAEVKRANESMYNRQALFCAKIILFAQNAADIRAELKNLYGVNYNAARGYLNKELKVSESACLDKELHKIITSGEKAAAVMIAAADYMQKKGFSYAKLFAAEKAEKKNRADIITDFVNKLTYQEALTVKSDIEKRLDYLKSQAEKAAAEKAEKEKAAAQKAAEKAAAQKAAAEKSAKRAAEKAAAEKRKIAKLREQAQKAAEKAAALDKEYKKRYNAQNAAAALDCAKKQGKKAQNAKRAAQKAA